MAAFKSSQQPKKSFTIGSCVISLLLVANIQFVAASVRWTSPPPAWTQTDQNDIRTVDMSVEIGSTQVHLRWSYTLNAGSLSITDFFIENDRIGWFSPGGVPLIFTRNDYRTRFNISRSEVATLIINKVTEREEAVYQCQLGIDTGDTWRYRIRVTVTVPANLTNVVEDQSVPEGSNVQLFCNASGNPTPNITWTRVLEDGNKLLKQGRTLDLPNINRNDSGTYRCTANNGIGNAVSHDVKVNVAYPAKVIKVTALKSEVVVQQSVSLHCEAEGNPQPTYQWTPCPTVCNNNVLNISEVLNDDVFTCTVSNSLGKDVGNVSIFIAGNVINVTLTITNKECTDGKYNQSSLWKNLNETVDRIFANTIGYTSAQLKNVRCGSLHVIVDLALKFNSTARESEVIDVLRSAASNNKFGIFQVNASSITGTRPIIEKTTSASPTTPTTSSDSKTWIIVVAVLVPLFVLFVVAGIIACCMYKKRQCKKKDSREVHNNEDQEQPTNDYAEVNQGYSSAGANRNSGAANPPAGPPVYAVVDKSKRREKKPKPGELQYAELADLTPSQNTPRTSASRGSYPATDTQYADVNTM